MYLNYELSVHKLSWFLPTVVPPHTLSITNPTRTSSTWYSDSSTSVIIFATRPLSKYWGSWVFPFVLTSCMANAKCHKLGVWFFSFILDSNTTGVKQIEDLFNAILWKEIQKCKPNFHFNSFYGKLPASHLGSSLRETILGTDFFLLYILFFLYTVHFGKGFLLVWVWFLLMASDWDKICPCWWEMSLCLIFWGYNFIWQTLGKFMSTSDIVVESL